MGSWRRSSSSKGSHRTSGRAHSGVASDLSAATPTGARSPEASPGCPRPRSGTRRPRVARGRARTTSAATTSVATPPITMATAGPSSWPATPDSNAPSSLEAPMNTASTASTRPRLSKGVTSGTSVDRMNTLIGVGPGERQQRDERHGEVGGRAEHDRADAEQRHGDQQGSPDMATYGTNGEEQRHRAGSDADRGTKPAEADRADAEPVLGDRRKERDRTAEQDREEVERDRAEQDRLRPHEPESLERFSQPAARAFHADGTTARLHERDRDRGKQARGRRPRCTGRAHQRRRGTHRRPAPRWTRPATSRSGARRATGVGSARRCRPGARVRRRDERLRCSEGHDPA